MSESNSPYTAVPPSPGQATGVIRLTIQGNALSSGMVEPSCTINGQHIQTRFGAQDVTVWAGRNEVTLWTEWAIRYGEASTVINVLPNQLVSVFYAVPLSQFAKGSIGPIPQKRNGLGGLLVVIAIILLILGVGAWKIWQIIAAGG